MSRAIHFTSRSIQGYGPSNGCYLPCSGVSISRVECRLSISCRQRASRSIRIVCNAGSNNYRRNSDSSKQNKHGFSRNRNKHGEERDTFDDFEEPESFSKNGPLLSDSGNRKGPSTTAPGPREREIVELFRKVQAQLRERTAMKEERKIEDSSQVKRKESDTVDSLLKLLRKHSVQQGRKNKSTSSASDFILERFAEESSNSSSLLDSEMAAKHEKNPSPVVSRPKSNFQKRSPVPETKLNNINSEDSNGRQKEKSLKHEADDINELNTESAADPVFPEAEVFEEDTSDEETDEIYGVEISDEAEEENEVDKLSEMKLVELRALAKSRGMKGFSKLKKVELVQLLLSGSSS